MSGKIRGWWQAVDRWGEGSAPHAPDMIDDFLNNAVSVAFSGFVSMTFLI